MNRIIRPLLLCLITVPTAVFAQLTVNSAMTPVQLVQNVLLGGGVTASNITFSGSATNRGSFTMTGPDLGIPSGVVLSTDAISQIPGPAINSAGNGSGGGSDPDLLALSGQSAINNAAILEFDFIPTGDSLHFNFVFASEEYPSFVCSSFNDAFGFFLSGPGLNGPFTNNAINIALVPGTTVPITINTVNSGTPGGFDATDCYNADPNWQDNSVYFVDNAGGSNVAFNGFTTVLTALAAVECGQTYHIKLAIGNGTDQALASGVFLQAGSFVSTGQVFPALTAGVSVNDSTMFEGCGAIPLNFYRLGDSTNIDTIHLVIGGTSTPGVDYYPPLPAELIYQPGDTVISYPLNIPYDADGIETLTIQITQNVVCSGMLVTDNYTFYIDQYPPLQVVTNDVNGLCGESYDIGPQVSAGAGMYQYLWSTGDTSATINVSVDTTTTFYVTVTDTCSVAPVLDSITVNIPQYAPLAITTSPDIAIPCLGSGTIALTSVSGGNGQYTYSWSQSGLALSTDTSLEVPASDTLWYVMTVEEGCGHTTMDSTMVTTVPLPDIQIISWDSTVFCIGDSVLLTPFGVTGGNGVYTYAWTDAAGAVLSTADTLLVGVPADSSYTLGVQDQCGYSADSLFTTLIPHYAPFTIRLTPDTTICAGDSIALRAQVQGGSGVYALDWEGWGWNDPVFTYGGQDDATFIVDVIDHCGAYITDTMQVAVEHPETHILVANRGEDDWLFQATTVPFTVPVMIWDLGDGTIVKATSTYHSYLDLQNHWVTLHTVSFHGCPAVDSLLIYPPATLYFPNAFTPDGDGVNDVFGPVGASIEEFQMTIFDRWGHVVYETDDLNAPWDGKVNGGADATTGVYVYRYRAKGHYFEAQTAYGHVTLVRGSQGR